MRILIFLMGLLILAPAAGHAEETTGVTAARAYAYATAPNIKNGAVFVTLINETDQERALSSVKGDVAERIELHDMGMHDGVMQMRKMDAIAIPANSSISLEPTGYHVMLMGLSEPLKVDEHFSLTFTFDDGHEAVVDVVVTKPGQQPNG